MPQVTVYVRKDDLPKWEALKKKSEFIHNALNPVPTMVGGEVFEAKDGGKFKPIKVCKHGSDPKFCKFAKKGKCK